MSAQPPSIDELQTERGHRNGRQIVREQATSLLRDPFERDSRFLRAHAAFLSELRGALAESSDLDSPYTRLEEAAFAMAVSAAHQVAERWYDSVTRGLLPSVASPMTDDVSSESN